MMTLLVPYDLQINRKGTNIGVKIWETDANKI